MRQVASEAEFRAAVEGWIADDPDARDRAELQALLDWLGSAGLGLRRRSSAAGSEPGRWRNCGTGSRGGWSSGRPGCAAWSPQARTG